MAPEIVWGRLQKTPPGLTVLDPMSGSGTTAATAQRLGHRAIGFDSDPLAVKIASAWCAQVEEFVFLRAAVEVLEAARDDEHRHRDAAGPPTARDEETVSFATFWFDAISRAQLAALSVQIAGVRDHSVRTLLWCVFSRMIVTKEKGVSLAMDVSHSRPHRVYERAPINPFVCWPKAVARVTQQKFVKRRNRRKLLKAVIRRGDARRLPLPDETVDVVITSPPYLNAIDYLRGHRLSLIWMGYSIPRLRCLRTNSVGTELGVNSDALEDSPNALRAFEALGNRATFAPRERRMINRYVLDLDKTIGEVARVLRPKGRAIYVVGDCNLRGNFVENSLIIRELMQAHGLDWVSTRRRPLATHRRYLPPPCSSKAGAQLQGRMAEEVVIAFRKP